MKLARLLLCLMFKSAVACGGAHSHPASPSSAAPTRVFLYTDGVMYIERPLDAHTPASIADEELLNAVHTLIAIDDQGHITRLGVGSQVPPRAQRAGDLWLPTEEPWVFDELRELVNEKINLASHHNGSSDVQQGVTMLQNVTRSPGENGEQDVRLWIDLENNSAFSVDNFHLSELVALEGMSDSARRRLDAMRTRAFAGLRSRLGRMLTRAPASARTIAYLHGARAPEVHVDGEVHSGTFDYRILADVKNTVRSPWLTGTGVEIADGSEPHNDWGAEATAARRAPTRHIPLSEDVFSGETVRVVLVAHGSAKAYANVRFDVSDPYWTVCEAEPWAGRAWSSGLARRPPGAAAAPEPSWPTLQLMQTHTTQYRSLADVRIARERTNGSVLEGQLIGTTRTTTDFQFEHVPAETPVSVQSLRGTYGMFQGTLASFRRAPCAGNPPLVVLTEEQRAKHYHQETSAPANSTPTSDALGLFAQRAGAPADEKHRLERAAEVMSLIDRIDNTHADEESDHNAGDPDVCDSQTGSDEIALCDAIQKHQRLEALRARLQVLQSAAQRATLIEELRRLMKPWMARGAK